MNQVVVRNIQFMQQQSSPLFLVSNFVKVICICTVVGYLCTFLEPTVDLLAVTPGYLLPPSFNIWTLLTFFLFELHFWEVFVDIITLGLCGKLIEPLWGQVEMISFLLVCNLGTVILTVITYFFLYLCTKNSDHLFDVRIYGLSGYVASVSVAVCQIMPDHPIVNTKLGKLTNRNIPMAVLFLSTILFIARLLEGTYPLMFGSGMIVSWVYLRFFQHHSNGRRGDPSDSFKFEKFFPTVLQPFVQIFVNILYIIGIKTRLRKPRPYSELPLRPVVDNSLSDFHLDVERRKQIALKALSERLSSQKGRPPKGASSKAEASQQQGSLVEVTTATTPPPVPSPESSSASDLSGIQVLRQ